MQINNSEDFIDKLVSIKPTDRQKQWQELEYYNFIHYGINAFTKNEWGTGTESPSLFNPTNLNTDQWCDVLKKSGSKGVILTAKHHDGFCLFQSNFTDYSIKKSPYKDGKGDILKELSLSCKKFDLKLGVYLSPWDRNHPSYGTEEYNNFFCNQLTELLTNYGELFAVWFDGACGEGANGKKQIYDFPRYYALIRKYQPNAVITVCGPDVRWIGNEGGIQRKSEFSVVDKRMAEVEYTASLSQQVDGQNLEKALSSNDEDLGSRTILSKVKDLIWYPAEMNVSITKNGWFWSKRKELFKTRSVYNLFEIYLNSVGHNSSLLLNIPVNDKGLIPKKFENRLTKWKTKIDNAFTNPIDIQVAPPLEQGNQYIYDIIMPFATVSSMILKEDLDFSQRIENFKIQYSSVDGIWQTLYTGTTVGYKQICIFRPVNVRALKLIITACRKKPMLKSLEVFR